MPATTAADRLIYGVKLCSDAEIFHSRPINSSFILLYFVRNSRIVADEFGTATPDPFIFGPLKWSLVRTRNLASGFFTVKTKQLKMNDLIKNPIIAFIAGLLILWLIFKALHVVINLFWVFVLAFIILYFVNDRFRRAVRMFLGSIFRS